MPTAFVETIGVMVRFLIICGVLGVGACVDARDPQELSFACADVAPCADGYFCSPVLGQCVILDASIPCGIDADCPQDGSWRCNVDLESCEQDTNP